MKSKSSQKSTKVDNVLTDNVLTDNVLTDNEYNVKKIHRKKKDKYLVEWENYSKRSDYTWETEETLKNCIVFQEYIEQNETDFQKNKREDKKRKKEEEGKLVGEIFKKNKRANLSQSDRFNMIQLQCNKCYLCLDKFSSLAVEIDHIIPLELGGTNDPINLQALCPSCHIFKTSVLDRGVIEKLLRSKKNSNSDIARIEILEECQMAYANRHRHRPPLHEYEMLNFCISTVDIYKEMCNKQLKSMKDNLNTNKSHVDKLLCIIENMVDLSCQSNKIKTKYFELNIDLIQNIQFDKKIMYDFLNTFFKTIYDKKLTHLNEEINNIRLDYTKI
jgi:5-methylcytosine-specific restriction endonuclease McrA